MYHENREFLDGVPAKTSFIFGCVTGIATVAILLLGFVLSSDGLILAKESNSSDSGSAKVAAANDQPAAAAVNTREPSGELPKITDADHIRGDKNAPLAFIEYSDIECPFCKRFHPTMLQMMDEYKGKVKWVYRHFPLSFHANASKEAEATECANELGGNDAFWKYLDALFERTTSNGTGFALDDLVPLAKELGLDEAKFKECLDSGKYTEHVQSDMAEGSSAGVSGTPGSFLVDADGNAQLVSGALPFSSIKSLLDAALAK
jgi:protein-disulfide isomerase